jgi:hypothetical protein
LNAGYPFAIHPAPTSTNRNQYTPNATASSSRCQIPNDPVYLPMPNGNSSDSSSGPSIALKHGHTAVEKVAGSHHKGKQCAEVLQPRKQRHHGNNDSPELPKRGHPKGTGNYTADDLTTLLDAVQLHELPLCQRGWKNVHAEYIRWARSARRPERDQKSLETKFKQVRTFPRHVMCDSIH